MSVLPYTADSMLLRKTFGAFPSGVAALAAVIDGEPTVLIASSFSAGVSMEPPMVMFAVQNTSTTWPELARAERIGVSILAKGHGASVRQLASKDKAARLDNIPTLVLPSGAILLDDAPVWLECTIAHDYPAGDHRIIVLQVVGTNTNDAYAPLIFHNSAFHEPVAI
ncbi:flavin reductase family protein [Subtercola boreus]|uniref:Oxidoreductase n=1 Tax=Subtercola boreus TaxID=120213 RepID=A0A3E0W8C2_9MICO|nr:flavin reductase family protein [Subtercola boreus]RFA19071.1 oxidoreductase [Subtercola boreus]RFA19209.1 oxidoreductase [Subtercola boreus]RFA25671.1 oxidoreductase [Subtercola boreus]